MSSTLQAIRNSIQLPLLPIAIDRIYYGLNNAIDATTTPYITFTDFTSANQYDTCGPIYSDASFIVHVFAPSLEQAEDLAFATNAQLELKKVTPTTMALFQNSYTVVQEDLYVFHVAMAYDLKETY